jgi:hypothetical protein
MPTPQADETLDDFMARCVPIVLDDGTAEDEEQAVAVCASMFEGDGEASATPATLAVDPLPDDEPVEQAVPSGRAFHAETMFERATGDGREFADGSISWRTPPISLMYQSVTAPGHDGAVLAGTIERVVRDGDTIHAYGHLLDNEDGTALADVLDRQGRYGISADYAVIEVELLAAEPLPAGPTESVVIDATQTFERYLAVEIMGATATPFPAFADAYIELVNESAATTTTTTATTTTTTAQAPVIVTLTEPALTEPAVVADASVVTLTRYPVEPPVEWFDNPDFDAPQRHLTITDDGHLTGHLAIWGECHIGHTGQCVVVPRSLNDYAYFTTGLVKCFDGCEIPTGPITLDTGHAPLGLNWRAAAAHYDNTGTGVADVAIGEDRHGVWIAGALRPTITPVTVRTLRASGVSGDWRPIGGHLELVAALAVNTPGFAKVAARVASGQIVALVASAQAPMVDVVQPDLVDDLSRRLDEQARAIARLARRVAALDPQVRAAAISRLRR